MMICQSTYYIESLEHLPLITRPISIKRKRTTSLTKILLCECHPSSHRHLSSNNPVPAKESRRKEMHRPAPAPRHAALAPNQLAHDPLERPAAQEGERVAAVGGDDAVILRDRVFEPYRDRFLTKMSLAG